MKINEYCLLKQRENILSWYPFAENDEVLFIGEDYGVIAWMLANKVKKLALLINNEEALESNKRYNKCFNNIEYLNEMDMGLYDKVILVDGLSQKNNCLLNIKKLLKDGGHLLLIGFNKMGVRYLAGGSDDKCPKAFTSFDNYLSKHEYDLALKAIGVSDHKYYYPYPDHILAHEIFTDTTINTLEPSAIINPVYLDGGLLTYPTPLDERRLFSEMRANGLAGSFNNSFFIDCVFAGEIKSNIDYEKVWSLRSEEYAIRTAIDYQNGKVYKYPYTKKAIPHLEKMASTYWNIGKIESLPYYWDGEKLTCDIIKLPDMTTVLNGCLKDKEYDKFWSILNELKEMLYVSETEGGYCTSFKEIFGDEECHSSFHWLKRANVDLNAGNIFMADDKWLAIDMEWFMEFDIPAEFVLWCTLLNSPLVGKEAVDFDNGINDFVGIDETTAEVFRKWKDHFLFSYQQMKHIDYRENLLVDMSEVFNIKSKYESLLVDYNAIINSNIWKKTAFLRKIKDKK